MYICIDSNLRCILTFKTYIRFVIILIYVYRTKLFESIIDICSNQILKYANHLSPTDVNIEDNIVRLV